MLPELDQTPSLDLLRTHAQTGDPAAKKAYQRAYQEELNSLAQQFRAPGLTAPAWSALKTHLDNITAQNATLGL